MKKKKLSRTLRIFMFQIIDCDKLCCYCCLSLDKSSSGDLFFVGGGVVVCVLRR